jgi:hypothetical protein
VLVSWDRDGRFRLMLTPGQSFSTLAAGARSGGVVLQDGIKQGSQLSVRLTRLDASGAQLWQRAFPVTWARAQGLRLDAAENVAWLAQVVGDVDLGGGVLVDDAQRPGSISLALVELDAAGHPRASRHLLAGLAPGFDTRSVAPTNLAYDAAGDLYLMASFAHTLDGCGVKLRSSTDAPVSGLVKLGP